MVDGISRIYSSQIQPPKSAKSSEKKTQASRDNRRPAERLLPDLRDKVEISDEGRKAAQSGAVETKSTVSKESTDSIGQNWYSAGYQMAAEEADSS